jgi:hypothetical protein
MSDADCTIVVVVVCDWRAVVPARELARREDERER